MPLCDSLKSRRRLKDLVKLRHQVVHDVALMMATRFRFIWEAIASDGLHVVRPKWSRIEIVLTLFRVVTNVTPSGFFRKFVIPTVALLSYHVFLRADAERVSILGRLELTVTAAETLQHRVVVTGSCDPVRIYCHESKHLEYGLSDSKLCCAVLNSNAQLAKAQKRSFVL